MPSSPLPQLPLMLAGGCRTIAERLRQAGISTAPLPRVPLSVHGVGRFVLYDSADRVASHAAARAKVQGLELIDLASLNGGPLAELEAGDSDGEAAWERLLLKLKEELEARGGVWVRLADYPYPYQGVLCIGLEHHETDARELRHLVKSFPEWITHWAPPRLTQLPASSAVAVIPHDVGWLVDPAESRRSVPSLVSKWRRRRLEFAAAGFTVQGIALLEASPCPASPKELWPLGLEYSCRLGELPGAAPAWDASGSWLPPWLQFSAVNPLEDAARLATQRKPTTALGSTFVPGMETDTIEPLLKQHYSAGEPVICRLPADAAGQIARWTTPALATGSWPLLWRTNLARFTRWWRVRSELALRVLRTDGHYTFELNYDSQGFAPAIELWRGGHVAMLPLPSATRSWNEEGLAFLRQPHRSPLGFAPHLGGWDASSRFASRKVARVA